MGSHFSDPVQGVGHEFLKEPVVLENFEYADDRVARKVEKKICPSISKFRAADGSNLQVRSTLPKVLQKPSGMLVAGSFTCNNQQVAGSIRRNRQHGSFLTFPNHRG